MVAGLAFHATNFAFPRLAFVTLRVCYVAFVPWDLLMRSIGRRLPSVEVLGGCRRGRSVVAAMRAVDVLDVVHPGAPGGPLVVAVGEVEARGWPAVRLLNRRVPAT